MSDNEAPKPAIAANDCDRLGHHVQLGDGICLRCGTWDGIDHYA